MPARGDVTQGTARSIPATACPKALSAFPHPCRDVPIHPSQMLSWSWLRHPGSLWVETLVRASGTGAS